MVATPLLSLTITTPAGVTTDYSAHLGWSGVSGPPAINQQFGRQGDTATFTLIDEYDPVNGASSIFIPVFSQIVLTDNTYLMAGTTGPGTVLFAGVVNDPQLVVTAPNRNEWVLKCTDYTFYADNAIVQGTFIGQTVDQIVVALTQQANCGITAATTANGGFVSPGPQLASFVSNFSTLSAAWRKLAQLAGQMVPYGWYVDQNRNLHFYDATSAVNSGVTFTTSPTTSGSFTEAHVTYDGFHYEWDGQSVRNRILVQGATQVIKYGNITNPPTDVWQSNGVQSAWTLRFTVTGTPVLHVGGTAVTVAMVNAGQTSTSTWQVIQDSIGKWTLTTTSIPPAGQTIQLWYDYLVPIIAQADDFGSQTTYTGPNHGVFMEYISDTSLTTVPMALARAQRQRSEYAFAAERYNFTTSMDWLGWVRAGQACTVVNRFIPDTRNSNIPGINGSFIVISNSIQFGAGGYRTMNVTAIRL